MGVLYSPVHPSLLGVLFGPDGYTPTFCDAKISMPIVNSPSGIVTWQERGIRNGFYMQLVAVDILPFSKLKQLLTSIGDSIPGISWPRYRGTSRKVCRLILCEKDI